MPRIEEFDDVQLDVEFTQASSRSNLTSKENIAISFGKISKWYEALVPTGGSSGQFLAWNSSGTAKWVANPNVDTKVTSTLLAQSTAAATYLPTFVSVAGNGGVNIMNSFSFRHTPGTTSDVGNSRIVLGNATASGTANNEEGQMILYSSGTSYHTLKGDATVSVVTHSLPTTGGTILNTGTTSFTRTLTSGTKVGSIKINGTSTDIYAPTVNNAALTLKGAGTTVTTFTANASSAKSLDIVAGSNVTVTADATNAKISIASSHPTITKSTDTTSTASPAHGGTFTTVDSVTRDSNGHVTKINTKTVTLPADSNTDTLVSQTFATADNNRPLLMSYYNTGVTTTTAQVVHRNDSLYFNPSSGGLYSFGFLWTDITGSTLDINTLTLSNGTPHSRRFIEKTDGGATNITNIPVAGKPFLLEVDLIRWASTTDYITRQRFTNAANGAYSYVRYCTNGTWGSWTTRKYTDTDTKVTSSANHYAPATVSGQDKSASATGATAAWSIDVVKGVTLNTDGKGHVTGISVTSGKIPGNPVPSNNVTGSGTSGYLTKWNGANTITNGPQLGSSTTTYLRNDGTWATPTGTTYSAGTGLSLSGTTFNHSNSVTAVTSAVFKKITYDAQGHITGTANVTASDIPSLNYVPNTQAGVNTAINLLSTGSSIPNDADYYISQYVGGGTTTTTYHRRPMSALWSYINGKISATTSGSGNAVTSVSYSNGALTVTKGSTFSLSTHTHSNYLPMSTVSSSTDADTLFTTSQWINWNTTTEVETTHMPTTNYGILLAKAYPGIQVFIPDTAAGIYFRKKTNASTAATAWWGITGTAGNTYNLNNFLPLSGGTLTGAVNFANNTMNKLGDDVQFGDGNVSGHMIVQGLNNTSGINLKYASNSYPNCNMTVTTKSLANTQFIGLYNYDASGTGIVLGGETGGLMVLGGGESPIGFHNIMTNASTNPLGVAWYDGTEKTLITSDNEIYFMSGAQSLGSSAHTDWTNCKTIVFDSSGNFNPTITNKGSVGTASKYWATSYITTMYGQHKRSEGGSWISARTNAAVWSNSDSSTGDSFYPATFSKTKSGGWAMGTLGNYDRLAFSYTTDADFSNNTNTSTYTIFLPSASGTVALTNHTHNYAGSSSVGGPALSVSTAGGDVVLGTPSSSSDDSGDIYWKYGNGQEKARLWQDNTYTAKAGPQYRIYKSDGTSLYSGRLPLADGTSASGTWGISITGNATRADYVNVVASNEIRFYNDNQFKANDHFWLGYSWAAGSHYTPSGGSDTSSMTAPNITEFLMGNCSGGGLASVHAKTFILGNGSSPTSSSKTTTITTAATTTDRTITLPDASGTVALLTKGSTSYWGMIDGDGATSGWIRTTTNGLIAATAVSLANGGDGALGTSSWAFKEAYIAKVHTLKHYGWYGQKTNDTRQTTANLTCGGNGAMQLIIVSSSLTTGRPPATDGYIMDFDWDNTGSYKAQLFIPNSAAYNSSLQWRSQTGSSDWSSAACAWRNVLDANNLEYMANHSTEFKRSFDLDMPMSPILRSTSFYNRANRFALIEAGKIVIQYSSNNGSTWADMVWDTADNTTYNKSILFNDTINASVPIGPMDSSDRTTSMKTRIIVTVDDRDVKVDQFLFQLNSAYQKITVTLEASKVGSVDTFETLSSLTTDQWDYQCCINTKGIRFTTSSGYYAKLRITFGYSTINSSHKTSVSGVLGIAAYSGIYWGNSPLVNDSTGKSDIALYDRPYAWMNDGTMLIPVQLKIFSGNYGTFIRNDGTNTYFLLTDSGYPQTGSWNSLRPLYFSNSTGFVTMENGASISSSAYGALSIKRTNANNAGIKFYNNGSTYLGSLAIGTVNGTFHRFKTDQSTMYEIIDRSVVRNNTVLGTLGWTSSSADTVIPTVNTIAFWNGAYSGTSSNLAYCKQGAFGTIVTKSTTDYSKVSISRNLTSGTKVGTITIDGTATDLYCETNTTNANQTNTTTNADYRVLFSTNANDTTQSGTTRKNINLQYNPSTATLKIGDYVSGSTATKNGKLVLGNSSNIYTHTINTNADKLSNVSLTLNSTDGIMGTDTLCYKGYESANLASDTAPGTLADISSLSNAVSFSGYLARFSYFTVLLCIGTDVTARATVQISAVTGYQSYQLIWGAAPSHAGGNLSITSGLVNISESSGTITLNFGKCASYWQFSSASSNPTRGTTPDIHVLKVYGHSIRSNGYH